MAISQKSLSGQRTFVDPRDWSGFDLTGSNANDTIIQAAIAEGISNRWPVHMPAGIIAMDTGVTVITGNELHIRGAGRGATRILFNPSADAVAFTFESSAPSTTQQNNASISDLRLYSTDTTYTKTMIKASNVSKFSISDVTVYGSTGPGSWLKGANSRAIEIAGREQVTLKDLSLYAMLPLYVTENPSEVGGSYDTDHFNFHNLTLSSDLTARDGSSTLTHACVLIGDDVRMSPFSFTGHQAWVGGVYGLYWDNSTSAQQSAQLIIHNLLTEQGDDLTTGYSIYIIGGSAEAFGLANLTLVNCQMQSARRGFYCKYVNRINMLGGKFGQTTKRIMSVEGGRSVSWSDVDWTTAAKPNLIHFPSGDYVPSTGVPSYGSTTYLPGTATWRRDDITVAATTMTVAAVATDTVLTVASIADADFQNDAPVKLRLDSGRWHVTTINGVPAAGTITLNVAVPTGEAAAIGNEVITHRVISSTKADQVLGDGETAIRRIALDTGHTFRLPINASLKNVEQAEVHVQAYDATNNVLAWGWYALTPAAIGTNGVSLKAGTNAVVGTGPASGEISLYAEAATLGADIRVKSNLAAESKFLIRWYAIRTLQN